MGKGDKRTRRGKIFKKSYGNSRPKKKKTNQFIDGKLSIKFYNNNLTINSSLINYAVFPIISQNEDGNYFIGTGFFINNFGWFITAKHVAFDENNPNITLGIVQTISHDHVMIRKVEKFWLHETADIVVGRVTPVQDQYRNVVTNPSLVLKKRQINSKQKIFTYAYPDTVITPPKNGKQRFVLAPDYYFGKIKSISFRQDSFFNGICIQSNMLVKGGASGGPVFNKKGFVIGLNTSGFELIEGEEPISFTTTIQEAFDIKVPYSNNGEVEYHTLLELSKMKILILDEY
jgi:ribosomal small subunit protein bTHX